MSSISDKIEYLKETKSMFKQWIIDNGGTVTDSTPFRDYVDIIDELLTSGPPKPVAWITLDQVSDSNKAKPCIKWADYYTVDGLYIWSSQNLTDFIPTDPNTYITICSLTTNSMGDFKLVIKTDWGSDSGYGLMWINEFNGSYAGALPIENADFLVEKIDANGYIAKILTSDKTLKINTANDVLVTSAYGDSVVSSDVLIEQA